MTQAAKTEAISFAAYAALTDLFPAQASNPASLANTLMGSLVAANGYSASDAPAVIGQNAAAAVLAYRHADGSNQLGSLNASGQPVPPGSVGAYSDYSGYTTLNAPLVVASASNVIADPNAWQPLQLTVNGVTTIQKYATPFWGAVTPFSPLPAFSGPGPARYPSLQYKADALIVLAYSAALTDTTKMVAEYWSDLPGTQLPPGHWSRIGEFVSRRDAHTLDADAPMFFALNNALMDAGIAAWATKRSFNSERPITAIRYLFAGKPVFAWAGPGRGAQWIDGGTWLPYQPSNVVTPAFAEYTSGHSTFSYAAAAVLQRFTGSDSFGLSVTLPAGSSFVEPGIAPSQPVTFSFPTFSHAAAQAGLSRRYGGIHFIPGDLNGRADGYLVGAQDWSAATTYFNGGKPCVTGWNRPAGQSPYCASGRGWPSAWAGEDS